MYTVDDAENREDWLIFVREGGRILSGRRG